MTGSQNGLPPRAGGTAESSGQRRAASPARVGAWLLGIAALFLLVWKLVFPLVQAVGLFLIALFFFPDLHPSPDAGKPNPTWAQEQRDSCRKELQAPALTSCLGLVTRAERTAGAIIQAARSPDRITVATHGQLVSDWWETNLCLGRLYGVPDDQAFWMIYDGDVANLRPAITAVEEALAQLQNRRPRVREPTPEVCAALSR